MAQLLDLPVELLLAIFAFFHPVDDRPLLLSLCKVSRRTCDVVQPLLFSHFVTGSRLRCESLSCKKGVRKECRLEPLIPFARTIVARPDLGLRVQRLVVRDHTCRPGPVLNWPSDLTAETVGYFTSVIQTLAVKKKSRWLSAIAGCAFGPFMIMLISQTPNVKQLSLVLDWKRLNSLLTLTNQMRQRSIECPYLHNLTSLDINCFDKKPIQLQSIVPLLTLPRLEEVSIAYCTGSRETEWPEAIAPGTLGLSAISLSPAGVDKESLTALVSACACLRRFTYVAMDCQWIDPVDPQEIQAGLEPQRDNLKELRIEYRTAWNTATAVSDSKTKYGSFRGFTSLTRLDVEQSLMMSIDELPPSLEILTIRQSDHPIFSMTTELVSTQRTACPSLREVIVAPYALAPYAMVGLHRYRGADYFASNEEFWAVFDRSCQRLERIFEGSGTALVIDSEAWRERKKCDALSMRHQYSHVITH